ncbi:MAG: 50S ribosomal protein L11 methyltransferase [Firmicutes bacterium]|nr:50S ribosomal protein L11 methyltransferase [Bacillota bacterium]
MAQKNTIRSKPGRGRNTEWAQVNVLTSVEAIEAVSNRLIELGAGGTVLEGSENGRIVASDDELNQPPAGTVPVRDPLDPAWVTAYFPHDGRLPGRLAELKDFLAALPAFELAPGPGRIQVNFVSEEDWAEAWKAFYHTQKIGRRLVIKPSWEEYQPAVEELVIELDPGMAFGTGTHPSTVLGLEALEDTIHGGEYLLDVGAGTGILAIAAARLGAGLVEAVDADPVAVEAARANVAVNHVEKSVAVREEKWTGEVSSTASVANTSDVASAASVAAGRPADVIVANLVAALIISLAPVFARRLSPGGILIAAGIVKPRALEVEEALARAGFALLERREREDWICLRLEKAAEVEKAERARS